MAQSNCQKEILFPILVLVTLINSTSGQQKSVQLALCKPEFDRMYVALFFTNESAVFRCNHEPGEQVDVHRVFSANPVDNDWLVVSSTLNEIYEGQFRVEDHKHFLDLIVYDVENINGSCLQCVPRVHTSPCSLQIFVATPPSLIGINSTTYALETRDDVVIESVGYTGCFFVAVEQTRTSAFVYCKSGMNESCSVFIVATLSSRGEILERRNLTLEPECLNADLLKDGSNLTMPTMGDNLDKGMKDYTEDDRDGGQNKAKLSGKWLIVLCVGVVIFIIILLLIYICCLR